MSIVIDAHIELKGGLRANLPASGFQNEPFFCEDTGELFVWNGSVMKPIGAGGGGTWGSITGTLTSQTDLQTALNALALKTTTVNGHALSSNIVVSASDITIGTLPHAQLPSLVSGDIPNNAANTSGTAANLSGTPTLPNGTTATTQASSDASGKLATTQFVANAVATGVQVVTVPLTASQIINTPDYTVQVLPAPGAGKVTVLVSAALSVTNGSNAFQQPLAFQPTIQFGTNAYFTGGAHLPAAFFNNGDQIGLFLLPSGTGAIDTPSGGCENAPITAYLPIDAGPIAAASLGSDGGSGYAPGDTGTISDGNNDAEYTVDTVTGPNTFVVASCANHSGSTTVYNGTFTGGAGNAFVGHSITIAGFVAHGVNNGTFNCTASSATQLTLANASGIAETHAATATDHSTGGAVLTFHLTNPGSCYTDGVTDDGTSVESGNGDGGFLVNVDQITPGNGTMNLTLAYYTVNF